MIRKFLPLLLAVSFLSSSYANEINKVFKLGVSIYEPYEDDDDDDEDYFTEDGEPIRRPY